MKLLRVRKSRTKGKKYDAVFKDPQSGEKRVVPFGATGYQDYTQHKDKARRTLYRERHRKDRINFPQTPGALSWHILWGESTNLKDNVKAFKSKFGV